MKIDAETLKKQVILHLPYVLFLLVFAKLGEAVRLAPGADASQKLLGLSEGFALAFQSMWPGAAMDWLIGFCGAAIMRLAVYLRGKDAKKYRKNVEYGSARWGNKADIAPFMDPNPENNIILTQSEGLMLNGRPKNPANARNKNVLVVGGSGSGKTRFFIKPNLMQMHSSYVVTDPKGTVLVECGKMLQRGTPKLDKDGKPCKFFRVLKLLPIFLHQIRGKVCKIFLAKTNDQKIPGHNIIDVAVIVKESSVQRQPHQLAFFIADQSHRVLIRIDRLNISAHCRLQGFQTTFDLRSIRGLARLYH